MLNLYIKAEISLFRDNDRKKFLDQLQFWAHITLRNPEFSINKIHPELELFEFSLCFTKFLCNAFTCYKLIPNIKCAGFLKIKTNLLGYWLHYLLQNGNLEFLCRQEFFLIDFGVQFFDFQELPYIIFLFLELTLFVWWQIYLSLGLFYSIRNGESSCCL